MIDTEIEAVALQLQNAGPLGRLTLNEAMAVVRGFVELGFVPTDPKPIAKAGAAIAAAREARRLANLKKASPALQAAE